MTTQAVHQQLTLPDGRAVGYQEWGRPDGAVVLLLHGLSSSSDSWRLAGPLIGERYRVIALDARGHGGSDWTEDYSFPAQAADVTAAMDALGVLAAVLVGHSMGGLTAFQLAVTRPERVRALVLTDAPAPVAADPPRPVRSGPDPADDFDWRVEVAVAGWRNDPPQDWWELAKTVTSQTLVLGGRSSHLPQEPLRRWATSMPRGSYRAMDTGHGMHQERPGEFAAVVMPFLAGAVR